LIVAYNQYSPLPDASLEWAGVFLATGEHNEVFALAEPPTHDTWEPRSIQNRAQRSIVNIALREIRTSVNARYQSPAPTASGADGRSVARVANALGHLFSGIPGGAAGVSANGNGPTAAAARNRPRIQVTKHGPAIEGGERVSEVCFSVTPVAGTTATAVTIGLDVATGDGSTVEGKDRPVGAATPVLIRVEGPRAVGDVRGYSRTVISAPAEDETSWRVLANAPDGMLVSFSIEAEAVRGASSR
jgi:hypothetical protein